MNNSIMDKLISTYTLKKNDTIEPFATYVGCYRDTPNLDLPKIAQTPQKSLGECEREAKQKGYLYFGMQNQRGVSFNKKNKDYATCLFGNSYGKHGTSNNCTVHNNNTYGLGWANAIYKVENTIGKSTKNPIVLNNTPEKSRSYSSVYNNESPGIGHARSMIDSPQAWSAKTNRVGEWIKIDLGENKNIAGVCIQGRNHQYVKRVHIKLQKDNGKYLGSSLTNYEKTSSYKQTDYRGFQNKTNNGKTCQRWDKQYPH